MDHLHFCFENQMGDCNFECNSGIEQGWLRLLRTKIARKYQHTTCGVIALLNLVQIPPLLAKTHFVPLTKEIIRTWNWCQICLSFTVKISNAVLRVPFTHKLCDSIKRNRIVKWIDTQQYTRHRWARGGLPIPNVPKLPPLEQVFLPVR